MKQRKITRRHFLSATAVGGTSVLLAACGAPAPVVQGPTPALAPVGADTSVGVFLNLEDGARIWAGRFDSLEDAEQHAQNLTESLVRPEPGVWPRFGDQLVRPDAVVSVELSPRENP